MNKKIFIRVPATSANLGPGFDILGLALKLYNKFYFTINKNSNFITTRTDGTTLPFKKNEDLVFKGYEDYFRIFLKGIDLVPYDLQMKLELPFKGGLGSSASALACGFALGHYLHKEKFSKIQKPPELKKILYELAMLEGHPDNTTPAYIGGFIFSYFDKNELVYYKYNFPKNISLHILIPKIETSTHDSRKKLPSEYPTSDIIFNMSRLGTWFQFLKDKKFTDLKRAVNDKIHTEYRIDQIDFLKNATNIIQKQDACFTLSGSGPSVLIFTEKNKSKKIIHEISKKINLVNNQNIIYSIKDIEVDKTGTQIKILN